MEESIEGFLEAAKKVDDADLVEVRVDGLRNPNPFRIKELLKGVRGKTDIPLLLTNRWQKEGGAFAGREEDRIGIIVECMELADWVDIELRSEERDRVIEKAREDGISTIISYHNPEGTPEEKVMMNILKEELALGCDVAKLGVKANSKEDVLKLLNVTLKASKLGNVCTISMGRTGRISRIATSFFGSSMIYASVGKPTAPGQLSIKEVRTILDIIG